MIGVEILKWRDEAGDIKLKNSEGKILYLSGTIKIDPPLVGTCSEHWWGNLESMDENLGSWVLETTDRKNGVLRKRGEN